MDKKIMYVTVGLPRSGKTTLANKWMNELKGVIVNRDTIRLVAHGHVFRASAEPLITFIEETMVRSLLTTGTQTVIIDGTNSLPSFRNKWRLVAKEFGYEINFVNVITSSDECIKRAKTDDRYDLIPIIGRMAGYMTFPDISFTSGYGLETER